MVSGCESNLSSFCPTSKHSALLLTMFSSRDGCSLCCVPFGDRRNAVSSGTFGRLSGAALCSEIGSGFKQHQILQMALRKVLDCFARCTKRAFGDTKGTAWKVVVG